MAAQQGPPKKGTLSPDFRWRWDGAGWKPAKLNGKERRQALAAAAIAAQIHEERTAFQITREYGNDLSFHRDAARMAQNGFDVASAQTLQKHSGGRVFTTMLVIYRRRQNSMTLYTKQLAPEVRWMRCAACGHTVYEAPMCSFCGAPR